MADERVANNYIDTHIYIALLSICGICFSLSHFVVLFIYISIFLSAAEVKLQPLLLGHQNILTSRCSPLDVTGSNPSFIG